MLKTEFMSKLIEISISRQSLRLLEDGNELASYSVSTSAFGPGELDGSQCTPRGAHVVSELIGAGAKPGSVFVGREFTGEVWSKQLDEANPDRDWILSRIIWLDGCEPGVNQGKSTDINGNEQSCDTKHRYIYIHGTSPEEPLGVPYSHGCIRMDMHAVIELFDALEPDVPVQINP